MKWQYYNLPNDDPRVRKHVIENISMGVHEGNALSTRLMARISNTAGQALAIAFESLDLERIEKFERAGTYAGGKLWHEAAGTQTIPLPQCPIAGMVQFVEKYLQSSEQAIVVCENWSAKRSKIAKSSYVNQSRMLYFGEQVYHILAHGDTDTDLIDSTIRESKSQWGVGVCSICKDIPQAEIRSVGFFDEIVANTAHIFVPAFDGEGFLVWSPMTAIAPS